MLITFGLHFFEKCTKKHIPYLTVKFSILCSNKKKCHYGFKTYPYPNIIIPLANWTKFNAKKGGGQIIYPQLFKVGRAIIAPSSFFHEAVFVKFELQTHMEHLSSCRSRFLVVFVLFNLQFSVNSQFFVSHALNI